MLGWRLKSRPGYDPLQGMAVAHDVLEHFPDSTDSIADEFQALGASLWLRGETGYDRRGGDFPAGNLAAEFLDIFIHRESEGYAFPERPRYTRLGEDTEAVLTEIAAKARQELNEYPSRRIGIRSSTTRLAGCASVIVAREPVMHDAIATV